MIMLSDIEEEPFKSSVIVYAHGSPRLICLPHTGYVLSEFTVKHGFRHIHILVIISAFEK